MTEWHRRRGDAKREDVFERALRVLVEARRERLERLDRAEASVIETTERLRRGACG